MGRWKKLSRDLQGVQGVLELLKFRVWGFLGFWAGSGVFCC